MIIMMMKKLAACMLLTAAMIAAAGDRLLASPTIDSLGNLAIGDLALSWIWYAPDWSGNTLNARDFKADAGFPRRSPGRFETSGSWKGFRTTISARAAENGGCLFCPFQGVSAG